MANTLTLNTEETPEGLTPEEQDSLQVGEQLAQEESKLLAGKYENAEQLEKAYVELQKKLGDKDGVQEGQEAEEVTNESEETKAESEPSPAVALITEASAEYYENNNTLSPETIEKFSSMSSQDLVNAYLELQKNNPQAQQPSQEVEVSQAQINQIQNSVGGEAEYQKIVDWAGKNLSQNEITAYDNLVEAGNPDAIQLGLSAIKSKYENANGYEGTLLSGKAAPAKDTFRSQAQLVQAMSDPRYDNDPAYRQDVIAKLERSDIDF